MEVVNVKGHKITLNLRDSSSRRALQYKNDIISSLKKLGVDEDDIEVHLERIPMRRAQAFCEWYLDGFRMYYDYKLANKFIENLYIISKVIEFEVAEVVNGEKALDGFIRGFSEDEDISEQRKEARKILGVDEDCLDLDEINFKYKKLSKSHHPDMGGSTEEFKKINNAHKMLKRELG
jgi:hypothetical protein